MDTFLRRSTDSRLRSKRMDSEAFEKSVGRVEIQLTRDTNGHVTLRHVIRAEGVRYISETCGPRPDEDFVRILY